MNDDDIGALYGDKMALALLGLFIVMILFYGGIVGLIVKLVWSVI